MSGSAGGIAAERLRSFVERWERLQEEIEGLKADQKEILAEAKGSGFDTRTIRDIIKLRKMSKAERDEREALLDIYKAALGMLDGTPLGDAAVRRITGSSAPKPDEPGDGQTDIEDFTGTVDANDAPADASDDAPLDGAGSAVPGLTLEDARRMGGEDAAQGKPVTANPFPARDPRRAAWDEAWCAASGSDGMGLPAAWRRSTPKKPGKGGGSAADEHGKAA